MSRSTVWRLGVVLLIASAVLTVAVLPALLVPLVSLAPVLIAVYWAFAVLDYLREIRSELRALRIATERMARASGDAVESP